jgi:hypothetical protein
MALPEPVDIGSLGRIMQALQDHLKESARQGADEPTALDSQFIGVGEEAGEALGAYRRWRGFARRSGPMSDVYDELADVLIVTMVAIIHFTEVAQPGLGHSKPLEPGEMIEHALRGKLSKIFERGWVNKELPTVADYAAEHQATYLAGRAAEAAADASAAITERHTYGSYMGVSNAPMSSQAAGLPQWMPETSPNAVWARFGSETAWTYLGQSEDVDWMSLQDRAPYTIIMGRVRPDPFLQPHDPRPHDPSCRCRE